MIYGQISQSVIGFSAGVFPAINCCLEQVVKALFTGIHVLLLAVSVNNGFESLAVVSVLQQNIMGLL